MMKSIGTEARTRNKIEEKENYLGRKKLHDIIRMYEGSHSMDSRSLISENDELVMPEIKLKRANKRDQIPSIKVKKKKKSVQNKTPMRNSHSRKQLLQFTTTDARPRPKRPHKPRNLTPLKADIRTSQSKERESSLNKSNNASKLWIPSGHYNSMGRNKLASLGKQIYIDYQSSLEKLPVMIK
jgi:hypothetical protein